MSVSNQVLGMNARNFLYLNRYNKGRAKFAADDKLTTKKLFIKNNIPTATIIQAFATRKGLKNYSWDLPKEGFAIKPARGYGGEGILVFKNWDGLSGTTISSRAYTLKQIKSHILDIFDGIYSLQSIPDKAYIEGRIVPHRFFKKFGSMGLPDIRIIVFNKILKFIPGTKIKTSGIKIPNWEEIMLLATRAQIVSGLGFAGVDIVVEKKRGPIVLEINARPGLSIQNANLASLRERLERVEALNVPNAERGVEIARSIFAEKFSHKVKEERKILSVIEPVTIFFNGKSGEYKAKIDTGAYRSSIDKSIVEEFGFHLLPDNIHVSSASGGGVRPAIKLEYNLGGKKISTIASVADRSHLQFPIIIGRRDLKGFYVNPLLSHEQKSSRFVDQDDHYEYDLPEE